MSEGIYACCHVAEFPVQAILRLRPSLRNLPVAVLDGEAPLQRVCSHNQHASRLGVTNGLSRTQVEAIDRMQVLRRSTAEEQSAYMAILECLNNFSPLVESHVVGCECILMVNVAGTERLFGPPAVLIQTMLHQVSSMGIAANVTVSSNVDTAVCVARFGRSVVIESGKERMALSALPIDILDMAEQHKETFLLWGIRTLGDIAQLSPESLVPGFGQEGSRLHQLASGTHSHHFVPIQVVPDFTETFLLESSVGAIEALLFIINVMIDHIVRRIQIYAYAVEDCTLTLTLDNDSLHIVHTRPAIPSNDKALLLKLLHLDIEANPPQAPVQCLELRATPGNTKRVQLGLFSAPVPETSQMNVTLARLRAVVGNDRVGSPLLNDTHRHDAFHVNPFALDTQQTEAAAVNTKTAMRQMRPPECVSVHLEHSVPKHLYFRGIHYSILRAYGPWVTNGAWWSNSPWAAEHWDVIASTEFRRGCLACCLVNDQGDGSWRMEGMYD